MDIGDDVLTAVRALAESEGRSLGSTLSCLARRGLAGTMTFESSGVPVFEVDAGSPVITADMVKAALGG
ncbi:MAG: antitoxin [Acidimicrobiia bacterium]